MKKNICKQDVLKEILKGIYGYKIINLRDDGGKVTISNEGNKNNSIIKGWNPEIIGSCDTFFRKIMNLFYQTFYNAKIIFDLKKYKNYNIETAIYNTWNYFNKKTNTPCFTDLRMFIRPVDILFPALERIMRIIFFQPLPDDIDDCIYQIFNTIMLTEQHFYLHNNYLLRQVVDSRRKIEQCNYYTTLIPSSLEYDYPLFSLDDIKLKFTIPKNRIKEKESEHNDGIDKIINSFDMRIGDLVRPYEYNKTMIIDLPRGYNDRPLDFSSLSDKNESDIKNINIWTGQVEEESSVEDTEKILIEELSLAEGLPDRKKFFNYYIGYIFYMDNGIYQSLYIEYKDKFNLMGMIIKHDVEEIRKAFLDNNKLYYSLALKYVGNLLEKIMIILKAKGEYNEELLKKLGIDLKKLKRKYEDKGAQKIYSESIKCAIIDAIGDINNNLNEIKISNFLEVEKCELDKKDIEDFKNNIDRLLNSDELKENIKIDEPEKKVFSELEEYLNELFIIVCEKFS